MYIKLILIGYEYRAQAFKLLNRILSFSLHCFEVPHHQVPDAESHKKWSADQEGVQGSEICGSLRGVHKETAGRSNQGIL